MLSNYALRTNGSEHGTVYTSPLLVNFMLDSTGYVSSIDLSQTRVLEPAAGDGAFLLQILSRLYASAKLFNFDFIASLRNIKAYELDSNVATNLRQAVNSLCRDLGYQVDETLLRSVVVSQDFLIPESSAPEQAYDIIVGNPPYIRHEYIPENKRLSYRKLYSTFRHRSDIYIAFYEKALAQLHDGGMLCFICSNRWMKTKYGEALRELIVTRYSVDAIIDIEDKTAFDQDVDAYASMTLISNKTNSHDYFYYELITDLNTLNHSNLANRSSLHIFKKPTNAHWHIGEIRSFDLLEGYTSIEQQGYKIGIGVASGADKVFIGKSLPVENDLKLPIITAREIKNGEIDWIGQHILNPYGKNGKLVSLEAYPLAKKYLGQHAVKLKERHTAKKSDESSWYKTIDRIDPELIRKPKLLIPDMKRDGLFPIDTGLFYPHHNVYYVTHQSVDALKILGAFLMSDFCKEQINLVSVKMRGGFARWQSQNLRKILLPSIEALDKDMKLGLIKAYDAKDITLINTIVEERVVTPLL